MFFAACATLLAGFTLSVVSPSPHANFQGGQFVLVDGPELRKPFILNMMQTTVSAGKVVSSREVPTIVHFAETLVVSEGKNWTVTRTADGSMLGGNPTPYHYTMPTNHTIKIESDCGPSMLRFTFDGERLVLDDEKTKEHKVFRRL